MKRNDFFLVVLEPGLFLVRKFICFRIFCITLQKLIWQPFKNQWRDHFQKATLQDICYYGWSVFSDIFTLNTVRVMRQELSSRFLIQQTD